MNLALIGTLALAAFALNSRKKGDQRVIATRDTSEPAKLLADEAADALKRAAVDAQVKAATDAEAARVAQQAANEADAATIPTVHTDTKKAGKKAKKKKKEPSSNPPPELETMIVEPPGPMSEPAPFADSAQRSVPTETAPQPAIVPAGYDPVGARRMAPSIARNLLKGRSGYDHRLLKDFQRKAGIPIDGYYGGGTRGALQAYGIADPPKPFFPPLETIPYQPPA